MNLKKKGSLTGLGDRLGCYLIWAMIAEIKDIYIYTTWIYNNGWGRQYPSNILNYIQFPKRLIFISDDEYNKLELNELNYRWVYHGFDYIPETIYKSLFEDKYIQCSYDEMYKSYCKICREMIYKKLLPDGWQNRYSMIHTRRGDKKSDDTIQHIERIKNIACKFSDNKWIQTTDGSNEEYNITKKAYPCWNVNPKIRALEEFFYYKHAKIIIQSVGCNKIKYGGWSGFSYVPFQLGLAEYQDNKPILISCNIDEENSRLTFAKKYVNKSLLNIFMYDTFLEQLNIIS